MTIEKLLTLPKTGDDSSIEFYFWMFIASLTCMLLYVSYCWYKKKRGKAGLKAMILLVLCLASMTNPIRQTYAAEKEAPLEKLYEEYQYTTDNPYSDEAEELFEKEIERDGIVYRLSEIRTELLSETPKERDTIVIPGNPFLKGKEELFEPEEFLEVDDKSYRLADTQLEAMMIPAHEVEVKKEVLYDAVEALDKVPSTISVDVIDESTGQNMTVEVAATGQIFSNARWEDTFSFQVTFHEYGLEGYWLGDMVMILDSEEPDFKGYEKELLALIGASDAYYRIAEASWAGEAFIDGEGIRCRNATISGKKLVRDCNIVYGGVAVFDEEEGVRYVSIYESVDSKNTSDERYLMKAIGVYVPRTNRAGVLAALLSAALVGGGGYWLFYRKKVKQ